MDVKIGFSDIYYLDQIVDVTKAYFDSQFITRSTRYKTQSSEVCPLDDLQ